jgi:hypothetical protein
VVIIEGQRIPLPTSNLTDDEVRKLITPFWPAAANAEIRREEKPDAVEVTLVKQPGTKGGIVDALRACPAEVNPAIAMYFRLLGSSRSGAVDLCEVMSLRGEIRRAMETGHAEAECVRRLCERLKRAAPCPGRVVPLGF